MSEPRKSAKTGSVEKIFDRLTVLVLSHELLLRGECGPLNPEQESFVRGLADRSKEVATLLRELLER